MTIHFSEANRRFIAEQVARGRYPSEDALLEAAVDRLRRREPESPAMPADPIIGLFHDDPGLLDEVVEEAMKAREKRPRRSPAGE